MERKGSEKRIHLTLGLEDLEARGGGRRRSDQQRDDENEERENRGCHWSEDLENFSLSTVMSRESSMQAVTRQLVV